MSMPDYSEMTVGQKLAKARSLFLRAGTSKSGKNMKLEFTYFELKDILQIAIPIFDRVGLINDMVITRESATAKVYNVHNMSEEPIVFSIPYAQMDQIVSKAGNIVTNSIQALGGSVTYLRRYLWMLVMEVIEPDQIEGLLGEEQEETIVKSKPKIPATPEQRAEAKKKLVEEKQEESATEEQIKELKSLCKELIALDEKQEDFVNKIALRTNGFTTLESSVCSQLIEKIKEIKDNYATPEERIE